MYSFLVRGNVGGWDEGVWELERDRFGECTTPPVRQQFAALSAEQIEQLKRLPALFAYEGFDQDVRLGTIGRIEDRGNIVRISYTFDDSIPPISFERLRPLLLKLDINVRGEKHRTHWAIKDEDLLGILVGAGVIDRPTLSNGASSGQTLLPRLDVEWGDHLDDGAFGSVWQATDTLLERPMAVKFLTSTDQFLDEQALLREARSLAKLSHPNLVTVYGAAWLKHPRTGLVQPAIMMELLVGTPLQRWRERQQQRGAVLQVARDVLRGVQAMHLAGLHHGDLHPKNVMILAQGGAKIIDWRYQDTFLERSTAHRRDLIDVEVRRTIDFVVDLLDRQGIRSHGLSGATELSVTDALEVVERLRIERLAEAPQMGPPSPQARGSGAATADVPFLVFTNPVNELITTRSAALQLVGASGPSSRVVAVAPHSAPYGGFQMPLGDVVRFAAAAVIPTPGDLRSFPPNSVLSAEPERTAAGVRWALEEAGVAFAIGRDGSLALRSRLFNDRQGEGAGRTRGDVGLYSSIEFLVGMICFGLRIGAQVPDARRSTRWTFRHEIREAQGSRLMCDPPVAVTQLPGRVASTWERSGTASDSAMPVAGDFAASMTSQQLSDGLDEVATRLADYFGVDAAVATRKPGTDLVRAYGEWLGLPS